MSVLNTFWHGRLTVLNNPDLQCSCSVSYQKFILEDAKDQRITWKEGIQSVILSFSQSVSQSEVSQSVSHSANQSFSQSIS